MVNDYKAYAIDDFKGPTVQIGDFGIGFGQSDYWHESVNEFQINGNHRFIRGNHDNPYVCKQEMSMCIPDGTIEGDVMYIGGAWSIDNPVAPPGWHRRTAEIDWWFDEECSDAEFEKMFEDYKTVKPRVMITHDAPSRASYDMFWPTGIQRGPVYPNRTANWFDRFHEAHKPEFWFFGHWHCTMRLLKEKTMFVCIDELDWIDVDLSDSEQIYDALEKKFL